jgi:acetyl-CoA carboxylase carboxyltransferase component
MREELEKLKEMRKKALMPGGEGGVKKQHAQGKLTVRERIDLLFDKNTFVELNMFAQHKCYDFNMEKNRPLGDAMVTGYGKINGRVVYLYAQDFTVLGGSVGFTGVAKIVNMMRIAQLAKGPVIGLIDTAGGRLQEGSGSFSQQMTETIKASGVVPQISAIMGSCAGAGVYIPALTDFIIMVEGISQMFITGPLTIKEATGEEISIEDLGGVKPHSEVSGVCDLVAKDEKECLQVIKKLLNFLPSSYLEKPQWLNTGDDPSRSNESLNDILPENPKRAFDMHNIISKVVDNGDFFEIKSRFARSMITGFARLGGYSVGIVANNPMFNAGAIDCDASVKAARFFRTCDCFNIPIITFVDVPGYMPGVKEEYKGIIRHGAKMLFGYVEATVPKITCIVRKAYGGAYHSMGSRALEADIVLAWPSSEIAVMGAEGAVNVLYRKEIEAVQDKEVYRKQKIEEYKEIFSTPYYAASKLLTDIVIKPQETRPELIHALEVLNNKEIEPHRKKHGNIPL